MMRKFGIFRWLGVVAILVMGSLIPSSAAFAAKTADVTITATPTYIAITNSEASWAIGNVAENTTYWWTTDGNAPDPSTFEDADMKSTISCNGTVTVDISLHAHNFTGGTGWTLNATDPGPEDNVVRLSAGVTDNSTTTMLSFADTTPQVFIVLSHDQSKMWCMRLITGSFTDGEVKTGVVTVSAAAH